MMWSSVKIGDIASMKYGRLPPAEVSSEGYPIFTGYRIAGFSNEYLYDEPQVVVVARGVGGTGDVKLSPEKSWITNLSIVLSVNAERVDKRFLLYRLEIEPLKEKLNTGAAQAQITIENLSSYLITIPKLETQQEIAETVRTYDELIENNRRRMGLFEEGARLLYQEWFVRRRFPGHEHSTIIDRIPKGWQDWCVSNFGRVITGKTPSTKMQDNYGEGVPFIKTPDMHGNVYVLQTESSLTEKGASTQPGKFIPENTLLISCIGTIGVLSLTSERSQFNQQINAVVPFDPSYRYYCFYAFKDLKEQMEAIGGGATMGNVNKTKFESLKILKPPTSLIREFNDICDPMFQQILILSRQNLKLRAARDLLLPRLMSGEIELSTVARTSSWN